MFEVMLSGNTSTVLGDTLVVLVSMTLLLFLVKYFAWDKVNAMLESRRDKISKEELKGSDILNNAREAASKTQDEMIKEGKEVVSRMKAEGQREVDSMKQRAIAQVQDEIVDLSIQLASQILEKEVTKERHQEVIESFIKGLEG